MNQIVCLKCGKMVDVDITKEKVFCDNCGNLIYENDGTSGYLKIVRDNSYFYSVVSLDCYINGVREAVISNGREVILPKSFGTYNIYVKYPTSFKSKVYTITLDQNKKSETIYVTPGLWNPKVKLGENFSGKEKGNLVLVYILYCIIIFFVFFILGFMFA